MLAWLVFWSAYAGRRLHRNTTVRAVTLAVYLRIISVSFTSTIHGQYSAASPAITPFPHLDIDRLALNWAVTSLPYLASDHGFLLL